MFHHNKELQFNARVSGPDPRFAKLLLEQFGGGNGELKAAMQYFVQSFSVRQSHPEIYDLLMDIGTEEFSHLEIVGATITMLLNGLNGELKNAIEQTSLSKIMKGKSGQEEMIHQAATSPSFLVLSAGGPVVTDSAGNYWSGAFVNANGEPTVDLRSNIAAEGRAKIVYEYLLQFTDDPYIHETLRFLMTREIAHAQMFTAALEQITPNFPPGVLQGDPRYTHLYFNMSDGQSVRGPWNHGQGPWERGEQWVHIENPEEHVRQTRGLIDQQPQGSSHSEQDVARMNREMSQKRSTEIKQTVPEGENQWSQYEPEPVGKR